jgi:hypothetical protein
MLFALSDQQGTFWLEYGLAYLDHVQSLCDFRREDL